MTRHLRETIALTGRTWQRVVDEAPSHQANVERTIRHQPLQFCGCGSSYFVAQTLAALDSPLSLAVPGSEFEPRAGWTALFITRSGTTTEILHAMQRARAAAQPVVLISGAAGSPGSALADTEILLDYAADPGVIQARFITATVLLWRWLTANEAERRNLGSLPEHWNMASSAMDIERYAQYEHFVALGSKWRHGLAAAASLCLMETAQVQTDYWHPLEFRHGPISCADSKTLVCILDQVSGNLSKLAAEVRRTGAEVWMPEMDPLVSMVALQRLAAAAAGRRGINADVPRHLSRSVELR